ncbi:hypothetical protein ACOMHN_043411 [Nucella lapillus]
MPARESTDVCGHDDLSDLAAAKTTAILAPSSGLEQEPTNSGPLPTESQASENITTTKDSSGGGGSTPAMNGGGGGGDGSGSGGAGGGGKTLIHPQRHNLKNRFELMNTLGEGTYGKVKRACEKATGAQVAIKYVKKTKIQDETDLNRIRREIRILTSLRHPNIVNIRQVFEKKDRIVLVMDYAEGGELYDYLNNQRCLSEVETRRIFRQIVAAVHYVHQNGIVHRDLKLENIILDTNRNVKIADFGLANYFSKNSSLNTFCGSPLYASPEIVNGQPYQGPEVDVWSLGVVLYTLAYGAMPFESGNLKVLRQQISTGHYAEPAKPCGASGLIRHMLTVNSARRATIAEVLNHWWVNLGYDLTPDGRQQNLMSLPLTRSSYRQHGVGSAPAGEAEADRAKAPSSSHPASLRRVPGSRVAGRTSAETSFHVEEMLDESGTSSRGASARREDVAPGRGDDGEARLRNDDTTLHRGGRDASQRDAISCPAGYGGADSELTSGQAELTTSEAGGNVPWSQALANSIREIRNRVIKSLASEESPSAEMVKREEAGSCGAHTKDKRQRTESNCGQMKDKVRSTPNLREVGEKEVVLASSLDKRHSLDSDKALNVFDSDKKPKRGILKRKGKFSGDDGAGCCMMMMTMDDCGVQSEGGRSAPRRNNTDRPCHLPLAECPLCQPEKPAQPSPESPVTVSAPPPPAIVSAPKPPCPVHHYHSNSSSTATSPDSVDKLTPEPASDHLPNAQPLSADLNLTNFPTETEGARAQSLLPSGGTFQGPSSAELCACTPDLTKVVRRRKGILKNGGGSNRNSLIEDARKRLSMGSQSSNSSADILDLSYDSADGEQMVCKSRSMDSQDMICRSQSSDNQDVIRGPSSLGCQNICKSRSTNGEDMMRQSQSKENQYTPASPKHTTSEATSICKSQSTDTKDFLHPAQSVSTEHAICKSQSVEENAFHNFRSSDLQKALSELSMSCSRSRRQPHHSYSFQPGDRGSFSLEGEFTALNLAMCDDALFDYSEARHVLQQALQFAN